ncbi:MAG: hypothetical protein HON68_11725 [Gammaproteobacteria bacterium]|jgi:hypothetical protein|nr:hypothetical protein [Gammaproteobacteria bacterium]MBT3488166.1 hypothetical protein [Gammaproteobacteria bacterium]MBT3718582.1 hypothetical protein [Gammaproteobacteria bacterium]MBT3844342.1 hypothetical protein [Gammaproteobacteria bacterium]MBT3894293.1 hypothetical protein [Gammaproteobacteria bacterium]
MNSLNEIEDQQRRLLLKVLALSLVSGSARASGLFGSVPKQLPEGRSIYRIDGTALVNGQPATEDTKVVPGDTIETGKDSQFIFVLGGHAMLMRSQSKIAIKANDKPVISDLSLVRGKLLSVSRGARMKIKTPVAVMGIRGTGWYAEAEPDLTYFCTCYGKTDVTARNDPTSRVSIKSNHHDQPLYILGDAETGQSIVDGPFINHTDEELALIETIVGRTPPFIFPVDDYSGPRRDY